jgi:hypothetical protein
MSWTPEQKLAWQRKHRAGNGNCETKRYEKTPNGFLMRTYRNMLSRVTGVQKHKAHLYSGLPILSRQEFYAISRTDPDFLRLFIDWRAARYNKKLTPSINRIHSTLGYLNYNIEWLTLSDNSRLGAFSRHTP